MEQTLRTDLTACEAAAVAAAAERRTKMMAENLDGKQPITFDNDPFNRILTEMAALHAKKGKDYGDTTDPYANVRASADFGVPPWVGALIRLNDKITRLKSFIRRGELANEGALDSIQDIAVYAVIMRVLYEEENGK